MSTAEMVTTELPEMVPGHTGKSHGDIQLWFRKIPDLLAPFDDASLEFHVVAEISQEIHSQQTVLLLAAAAGQDGCPDAIQGVGPDADRISHEQV